MLNTVSWELNSNSQSSACSFPVLPSADVMRRTRGSWDVPNSKLVTIAPYLHMSMSTLASQRQLVSACQLRLAATLDLTLHVQMTLAQSANLMHAQTVLLCA